MIKRVISWLQEKKRKAEAEDSLKSFFKTEFKRDYQLLEKSNSFKDNCVIKSLICGKHG